MRHPELPIVSFLCILLLLCSLASHIRAGSVATTALIAWLVVVSIIRGTNALVWANNVDIKLEVWCDITTKITIGFTYAIPASALCILRHLESVASTRNVRTMNSDKCRRQRFEAAMCFGLPLIGMALHYIVQGHRLDIIEDFGCYPPVYFSVAAILILWVPPFVMSLTTFTYAAMALRHFLRRRIEFAAHLKNSQSAITPARYFRLMAMAIVEMTWDTGVNAYLIYFNSFTGLRPWTTWDDVHSNFSRVAIFPEVFIPPVFVTQLIWQWWIVPISCIFFFIFFAFGEEAMSDYRAALLWFYRPFVRRSDERLPYGSTSLLPIHRCGYHATSPFIVPESWVTRTYIDQRSTDTTMCPTVDAPFGDEKRGDGMSIEIPEVAQHVYQSPNSSMDSAGIPDRPSSTQVFVDTPNRQITNALDESRLSDPLGRSSPTFSASLPEPTNLTNCSSETIPVTSP